MNFCVVVCLGIGYDVNILVVVFCDCSDDLEVFGY